jgi:hypothetical protein
MARTPEGEPCTIVATITTNTDFEETTLLLRRNLQRRLASRDLEVESFDLAVDVVTAGRDHHGVAVAALILPDSLSNLGKQRTGPVRKSTTRSAQEAIDAAQRRVDTKAPAARAMRPGNRTDFSL